MTELLITLAFFGLFTSVTTIANQMIGTSIYQAKLESQRETLANLLRDAITSEMRTANDISVFNTSSYNGHTDTAGFVYNSVIYDFLQTNVDDTFLEIIYVDNSNGQVYIGRVDPNYPTSGSAGTSTQQPKSLISSSLYGDFLVSLSVESTKTGVSSTISNGDIVQQADFTLAFTITLKDEINNMYNNDLKPRTFIQTVSTSIAP